MKEITLKQIIDNPRLINSLSKKECQRFIRDAIIPNYEKLIQRNLALQFEIQELELELALQFEIQELEREKANR